VPCTQELPFYQTLYTRYRDQDFHVVGISMDPASTITRVGPAARRLGITYDVVTDLDTRVTSQLNPRRSAPFSIWVNRQGRIVWEMEGFSPAQHEAVENGIRDLVAGTTAAPSAPPPSAPPASGTPPASEPSGS
jgi:peroxiredoxin